MNNYKTLDFEQINEKVHVYEHPSGLKAFVIPKKGYSKKYANFATHYGSINNTFISQGQNDAIRVPDGIAHFLEHKLFEQKDGSVMDKFSALGSSPNAYTSFCQTVYLFACTDSFEENFKLLVDYVQNPYITEESVEKEKGIIEQEIKMYEDDANWRSFFNLLGALYVNNPVKIDIAGTAESISKIDREVLYKCYNTFYNPSNMVILVVGDVTPESVFDIVEKGIAKDKPLGEIKRIFPEEPQTIHKEYEEVKLAVAMPLFQAGFKDSVLATKGIPCIKREVGVKLLLEMIMGKSSPLYSDMYSRGLINQTFDFDYIAEETYAFSTFGGESPDPKAVKDSIAVEIARLKAEGLDEKAYNRVKKSMRGKYLRGLNSIERISHLFMSIYFKDVNIFDYLEVYDKISFEDIKEIFGNHFDLNKLALSVVLPH